MGSIPFTLDEIEDVRIIIRANGKNYGIVPKDETSRAMADVMRRVVLKDILLDYHVIVTPSLEEIKEQHEKNNH